MKRPTDILRDEHRVIEQVLDCLEHVAGRCRDEHDLDGPSADRILDFLRTFADRCHHGKEEEQLFPAMETRGYSRGAGPLSVMLADHARGRQLIAGMAAARDGAVRGEKAACAAFAGSAQAYIHLLREHIQKEDHCLFPMADQALTEADQAALLETFRRVEEEEIGVDVPERYRRIARELAEQIIAGQGSPA